MIYYITYIVNDMLLVDTLGLHTTIYLVDVIVECYCRVSHVYIHL